MERDLRRRGLIRRAIAVGVLLVALVAVALLWPRPDTGGLRVATVSGQPAPTGVLRGALSGTREGDRVCYSVPSDGSTAVLRFTDGWTADPRLGLRDPSGLVVAQPGDEVVLLGAPAAVGTAAGCPTRGRVWTVTSVRVTAQR